MIIASRNLDLRGFWPKCAQSFVLIWLSSCLVLGFRARRRGDQVLTATRKGTQHAEKSLGMIEAEELHLDHSCIVPSIQSLYTVDRKDPG